VCEDAETRTRTRDLEREGLPAHQPVCPVPPYRKDERPSVGFDPHGPFLSLCNSVVHTRYHNSGMESLILVFFFFSFFFYFFHFSDDHSSPGKQKKPSRSFPCWIKLQSPWPDSQQLLSGFTTVNDLVPS